MHHLTCGDPAPGPAWYSAWPSKSSLPDAAAWPGNWVFDRPSCLLHHAGASVQHLHLFGSPAVWHQALQLSSGIMLCSCLGCQAQRSDHGMQLCPARGACSVAAVHDRPDWCGGALCRPMDGLTDVRGPTWCRRGHATPGSGLSAEGLTTASQAPPEAATLSARAVLEQAARRRRAAAAKYDGVQFGGAPVGSSSRWEQGSILNTTGNFSDLVGTCSSGAQQASPPRDRWWPDDEKVSRCPRCCTAAAGVKCCLLLLDELRAGAQLANPLWGMWWARMMEATQACVLAIWA